MSFDIKDNKMSKILNLNSLEEKYVILNFKRKKKCNLKVCERCMNSSLKLLYYFATVNDSRVEFVS